MSDFLWLHGLQHTRLPCPSLSSGVCSNSCPLNRWCRPTISFSVAPFSSSLQSFPTFFPISEFFASGGQSMGALASTLVLLMNIQGLFPLGLTGLISLLSERLSRVFSNITVWKHQFFGTQPFLWSNSHICTWLLEIYGPLLAKWWMSLLFNMLSRFVNALLWRSKQLLY